MSDKKISDLLKEKREERDISLDKVVEELAKQGIDINKSSLSRIENGDRQKIDSTLLVGLSNLYHFNFFRYLGLSDKLILVGDNIDEIELPVYGKASAGNGYINLDKILRTEYISSIPGEKLPKNAFIVEVSGNSMYPSILDGDLVIVDPNIEDINLNNKICVVTYEGQTFLKRIRISDKYITLMSDNSDRITYSDIIILKNEESDFKYNGIVIERRTKFRKF